MSESQSDSTEVPRPHFFGYPRAVEGPKIPYRKEDDKNPVFNGVLLVIGAWLISKLEFVQKVLWSNAGFDAMRKLDFGDYTERWDPTVIPAAHPESSPYIPELDPSSFSKLPEGIPGRYYSVTEYHAKYLSGELTPLAVAESLLPIIRRDIKSPSDHSLSFISTNAEQVLAAAKASTERYQAGKPLGVLDGVPTAIKDESNVAGYRTTYGRRPNDRMFPVAEESSWPVQKIEQSGAVILGKLNMHELGADTTNNNPNWGTPRNPHNQMYYTGGSSGGAAYAVAAGLVPFALGADGGGSIRIPSSFCGIYGLKPTHARLEDTGSTVTVSGPLAASMADLEAAYRILGTPNPEDPICALFTPPNAASISSPRPKVLGVYKDWFDRAEPSVKDLCQKTLDFYQKELSYKIVDITIPYCPEGQSAHAFTILSEMAVRARSQALNKKNWLTGLNPANKVLLAVGNQTPAQDYILAQQLRNILMQHLAFLYKQYPGMIIVSPATPMAGWPIASLNDLKYGITDGNTSIRNMEYVWLANFCGNPAISCPVGYVEPARGKGEGKVPVGLMGIGDWGSEDALLAWGREAEVYLNEVYEGGRRKPADWVDVFVNSSSKESAKASASK